MDFFSLITPQAVKTLPSCSSKKRLFSTLADAAEQCYGLDSALMLDRLTERERLGTTGVGQGIALPHAKVPGLTQVKGLFIRIEKPFDFDAVDRLPVDLVFCLLAPENAGAEHLQALALISRTMRDNDVQSKLRANTNADTLHAILTEAHATKAA